MMHLILEKIKERLFSDNLVRENEHLKAENSVLRKKLNAMHRRAQTNEGIAIRYAEYKKKHEEDVVKETARLRKRCYWIVGMYKQRYRDAIKQIVDSGVDNVLERRPDGKPFILEGRLNEMIKRCIADRDKAIEEKQNALEKLAMYRHEIGVDNDTFVSYDCHTCRQKVRALPSSMVVCPFCLDKRCPKADNHENECKEKAVVNDEKA